VHLHNDVLFQKLKQLVFSVTLDNCKYGRLEITKGLLALYAEKINHINNSIVELKEFDACG
tara:strand:+ start:1647 stop:1829 length:183 start_codon:yes stop_codon:yes gene_type:complete